jgi:hypothetical protein
MRMLCWPMRSPFSRSSRFPGGTASSANSVTRFCVSFLRAIAQSQTGQTVRASLVLAPSKTSSVPPSAKDRITTAIITAGGSLRQEKPQRGVRVIPIVNGSMSIVLPSVSERRTSASRSGNPSLFSGKTRGMAARPACTASGGLFPAPAAFSTLRRVFPRSGGFFSCLRPSRRCFSARTSVEPGKHCFKPADSWFSSQNMA